MVVAIILKNRRITAAVSTKFGTVMQFDPLDCSLKIQVGSCGHPEKSKNHEILGTV